MCHVYLTSVFIPRSLILCCVCLFGAWPEFTDDYDEITDEHRTGQDWAWSSVTKVYYNVYTYVRLHLALVLLQDNIIA